MTVFGSSCGSAQIVTVIGLLGAGLLGGCADRPEPAAPPTTPPPAATTTLVPPLPLPRPQPPEGPARPEPGLGAEDLALLAGARRVGAQWVILLVATVPDRTDEAAAGLAELGGVLGTAEPGDGHLRVTMPTDNVERVADLPTVTAVDVEQVISPNSARPHG